MWFRILPTLVPIMTGERFIRARDAAAREATERAFTRASDAVAVATHDPTASTIVEEASAPAADADKVSSAS